MINDNGLSGPDSDSFIPSVPPILCSFLFFSFFFPHTTTTHTHSGTTGKPKGVLYSHRSTLLHSYAAALPDSLNISARDVVLPVVPLFHVNAWGEFSSRRERGWCKKEPKGQEAKESWKLTTSTPIP